MAYEIDFLPVGDGERSGDAIALRFGNLQMGDQTVVTIDGGTKESGEALVQHIKTFYRTETVDAAICTHSDADHASGLTEVLESLDVRKLFMHLPWQHAENIDDLFKDPRVTANSIMTRFKKSLDNAHELASLAEKKGIPVVEPFSDTITANDSWAVLSPSTGFYEALLLEFRAAPEPKAENILRKAVGVVKDVVTTVAENWNIETLAEPEADDCSAENNSSAVLLFKDAESQFLFTSDAGVPALAEAIACARGLNIDLSVVKGIQVPHHGSKHNVGPAALNLLLGPKRQDAVYPKTAIVSAAKYGEPRHPSKKVVNAFMRRGARVFATQGKALWHHSSDAPYRSWGSATPLPFSPQVEE
ncbi:MAG TPA: MBL fold metallo-hydrolase [Terriglobales bacterium]|nr:MBL fold metallo-hydrolase [Terriglobales bacterium]